MDLTGMLGFNYDSPKTGAEFEIVSAPREGTAKTAKTPELSFSLSETN